MTKIAFKGGLLIDGTGNEPIENSLVVVEDEKIKYAGKEIDIGLYCEVIDMAGQTIIPG